MFLVSKMPTGYDGRAEALRIEAYDRGFLLQSTTTETILHLPAGMSYAEAIRQMLSGAGVVLFRETPSEAVLATDREDWPIGTSYLAIVNQLLSEINFAPVWFDAEGYAVLAPAPEPTAQTIMHIFDGTNSASILSPEAKSTLDIWGRPNVFIAICQNPDLPEPLVATAVNDSPLSALSTYRRGRRIAQTYFVDNIADQAELQAYAERLKSDSMFSTEEVSIATANVPGHGIGDVVAVRHPQFDGIYRETGWSLTLGIGNLMTHDLQRRVLI